MTKCNQEISYFLATIANINGLLLVFAGIPLIGDAGFFFPRFFMAEYFFKNDLALLSFRLGYCLLNIRAAVLGPFCSAYLAISKRSLSVYCLYLPSLSVSSLLNCSITLWKSTWPNVDSSVVIMGDDSSKNNNQIYYFVKFSLFLLCHVKTINKKIKKDKNKKKETYHQVP